MHAEDGIAEGDDEGVLPAKDSPQRMASPRPALDTLAGVEDLGGHLFEFQFSEEVVLGHR